MKGRDHLGDIRKDGRLLICTLKSACNLTAKDRNFFSVVGSFRLIQVIEVWLLGTPDPWECKSFPLKTDFRYAQVTFKTGLTCFKETGFEDEAVVNAVTKLPVF
jgi:hypothetical protein